MNTADEKLLNFYNIQVIFYLDILNNYRGKYHDDNLNSY